MVLVTDGPVLLEIRSSVVVLRTRVQGINIMSQPSILIVDDQIDFRESLARIFSLTGYQVVLAENGRDALDYVHVHRAPDVILLDLGMPGMCGLSFRTAQLRDPASAGMP